MHQSPAQQVAAEVRAEMARQRKSQADLAQSLGHSSMYYSRRLTGELAFAIDDLIEIADWLGVNVVEFLPKVAA